MPNVGFIRDELKKMLPLYQKIRDCIDGETAIKKAGVKYLPMPNAEDDSKENLARYRAYKERAVFYNVTNRTLQGLTGQIFSREPVIELPTELEFMKADADGAGVSLEQMAKQATTKVLGFGRSGILTDYPVTEQATTKAQLESGEIRPTFKYYLPWDIINWRKTGKGAKSILSLVVLREDNIYADDGFEMKKGDQWRVLRLIDGVYTVAIWRKKGASFEVAEGPFIPKDATGTPLNEIPFELIGAEDNDETVDNPPMGDISCLNIAHYRNSADYEESCFIVGQPTPYFSGLTEDWVKTVLKGTVQLGSRAAVPLPVDGSAGLLQADPNSMPKEAMEHKERQMVALGAKLVEDKQVQRTATEASFENSSETSTLASSANNVSIAFQNALNWCAKFVGCEGEIKFKLNTDFALTKLSPEEQKQVIAAWQGGAVAFTEMRDVLRRGGIATLDDKEAQQKIAEDLANMPNANDNNNNDQGNANVQ